MSEHVSQREAARIIGVSEGRVRQLIAVGQLPRPEADGLRRRDVENFVAIRDGEAILPTWSLTPAQAAECRAMAERMRAKRRAAWARRKAERGRG